MIANGDIGDDQHSPHINEEHNLLVPDRGSKSDDSTDSRLWMRPSKYRNKPPGLPYHTLVLRSGLGRSTPTNPPQSATLAGATGPPAHGRPEALALRFPATN